MNEMIERIVSTPAFAIGCSVVLIFVVKLLLKGFRKEVSIFLINDSFLGFIILGIIVIVIFVSNIF
jgi:hypothetical protein